MTSSRIRGSSSTPPAHGSAPAPAAAWRPSFSPWLVAVSVMLATFMEVLDTSVANVSLPHIAGSLSATTDEATWVLTSYLVANAIVLPATAWLGRRFGRKRFLLVCIGIFTLASVLSGAALSLGMLIAARVLQGAGGGALQPIAQAVLLESFPPHKRGQAMAMYGLGIVVAPILGPTLGGWITDNFSWRWIFYINVPIGMAAIMMGRKYIEDPPYIKNAARTAIDYIGFGLMAIWLGCQEIVFDKGQEADWFSSGYIVALIVVAVICLLGFILWETSIKNPIVHLGVLRDRNFCMGTVLITLVGAVLYGTTALLPLLLQTVMGYPATQSGLAVSPRGLGSIASMLIVGRLVGRVDARILIGGGFIALGLSTLWFGQINASVSMVSIIMPNILTGFALGFIFVPLTTLTTATLPQEEIGNATGIYNLMRNIGGSVGISGLDTLLERGRQAHQMYLVQHLTVDSPRLQQTLPALQGFLSTQLGAAQAHGAAAYALIYQILQQQSGIMSYIDDFRKMAILCALCLPVTLLFRPPKEGGAKGQVMVH
ncbi:MAG TPA: DHA2 family efflux MFS transporter permease subunit [Candidatus Xenobia bacterium]|jgi:DHA2 family multidrug resistance protein